MTPHSRSLRPALALVALGLVDCAVAQTGSNNSPFMPASGPAAVSAGPGEVLEFAGVNVMSEKTYVSVFDKQSKKGRWILVGGSDAGISVLAYDSRREQIVIKSGEVQKTLTLRKGTGTLNAPSPVAVLPPAAGFSVPPPGLTASPSAPSPAGSAPAPAIEPAPKPETPAKPLTVARQEEEARMLVSDLLEIGMAQRKAYEEAQRKSADGPTATPAAPTTPPPGG
jgi:hypothetical protein